MQTNRQHLKGFILAFEMYAGYALVPEEYDKELANLEEQYAAVKDMEYDELQEANETIEELRLELMDRDSRNY